MRPKTIDAVILETATKLDMPLEDVALVVLHQFSALKERMLNPTHIPVLPYFGHFITSPGTCSYRITKLIKQYRKNPTQATKDKISTLWKYRRVLQQHKYLRSFKKRFNT